MEKKYLVAAFLVVLAFALSACVPTATPTPTAAIETASPVPTQPLGTPGAEVTPGMETPTVSGTPAGGVTATPTSLVVESPTP